MINNSLVTQEGLRICLFDNFGSIVSEFKIFWSLSDDGLIAKMYAEEIGWLALSTMNDLVSTLYERKNCDIRCMITYLNSLGYKNLTHIDLTYLNSSFLVCSYPNKYEAYTDDDVKRHLIEFLKRKFPYFHLSRIDTLFNSLTMIYSEEERPATVSFYVKAKMIDMVCRI